MEQRQKISFAAWIKLHKSEFAAYCGLLFCIVFVSVLTPLFGKSIGAPDRLSTLVSNVIVLALMAVGAVFVYSLGNMDISIGKQVGLYATLIVTLGNATGSLIPGILLSLIISVVIAVGNGAIGQVLHIHPVVSSVVFMMVLGGINSIMYNMLGSRNIALRTIDYRVFRSTWVMVLALVIEVVVVYYLFNYTKYGKNAKAIGLGGDHGRIDEEESVAQGDNSI